MWVSEIWERVYTRRYSETYPVAEGAPEVDLFDEEVRYWDLDLSLAHADLQDPRAVSLAPKREREARWGETPNAPA